MKLSKILTLGIVGSAAITGVLALTADAAGGPPAPKTHTAVTPTTVPALTTTTTTPSPTPVPLLQVVAPPVTTTTTTQPAPAIGAPAGSRYGPTGYPISTPTTTLPTGTPPAPTTTTLPAGSCQPGQYFEVSEPSGQTPPPVIGTSYLIEQPVGSGPDTCIYVGPSATYVQGVAGGPVYQVG